MTNAEIANRLREIANRDRPPHRQTRRDLNAIANELDPQRPEPGTVIWWKTGGKWNLGYTLQDGVVPLGNDNDEEFDDYYIGWDKVTWKPARILADDEVAVKIPPVSEWPELAVAAGWVFVEPRSNTINKPTRIITRAEAERMEGER